LVLLLERIVFKLQIVIVQSHIRFPAPFHFSSKACVSLADFLNSIFVIYVQKRLAPKCKQNTLTNCARHTCSIVGREIDSQSHRDSPLDPSIALYLAIKPQI
jgi:hypothetical protein